MFQENKTAVLYVKQFNIGTINLKIFLLKKTDLTFMMQTTSHGLNILHVLNLGILFGKGKLKIHSLET